MAKFCTRTVFGSGEAHTCTVMEESTNSKRGSKIEREKWCVCVCVCGVVVCVSKGASKQDKTRTVACLVYKKKMLATTTHKELDEIRAGRVFAEFIPREDGSLCALLQ